jgi:pimeloyl-ACP methyl ester carboxylesterase
MKDSFIQKKNYLIYKYLALTCTLLFVLNSCLSLDPFLFKEEKVSQYLLDNYTGETECSDAIAFLGDSAKPVCNEVVMASGGETIYGILLRKDSIPLTSSDTIILYFHGTSDHIDRYWPRTRLLFATGYPVFVIDYKGYGKSTGEPTEDGINEDGRTALTYIKDSLNNPHVIVYSYSLGSLIGCEVTSTDAENQIIQLILEAPIGSVETLVQDATYINLPGSYVTTFTGNNAERIKNISIPLLWIHGTNDETIGRETNGLLIWKNYPGKQGYYIKTSAKHRTNPQAIGYSRYIRCLRDFIRDNDPKDPLLKSK